MSVRMHNIHCVWEGDELKVSWDDSSHEWIHEKSSQRHQIPYDTNMIFIVVIVYPCRLVKRAN